ncbi:MAG: carboxypeptidase regulatory-like domain-containing protein [Deltaproteobacteria bacterium]|nr:carboxypeptidase regulatory-like domain-containing protein [Deltaproteobacteria bacterium]
MKLSIKSYRWLILIGLLIVAAYIFYYFTKDSRVRKIDNGVIKTPFGTETTPFAAETTMTKAPTEVVVGGINYRVERGSESLFCGRVLSEARLPLENAQIRIFVKPNDNEIPDQELYRAFSDTEGFFSIAFDFDLFAGIIVEKEGYWPVQDSIDFRQKGILRREYLLKSGQASIEGHVVDTEGLPIEGVDIVLSFPKTSANSNDFSLAQGMSVTDSNGDFFIEAVPATTQIVIIGWKTGYIPVRWRKSLRLDQGEHSVVSFVFRKAGLIQIKVKNEHNRIIPHAYAVTGLYPISLVSDSNGIIKVTTPLEAEELPITIRASGYLERDLILDPKRLVHTIILTQGPLVSGNIIDQSGQPISDAKILLIANKRDSHPRFLAETTTDDYGTFSVHVSSTEISLLIASASGYVTQKQDLTENSDLTGLIVILPPADGAIYGRAIGPTGKPLRDFFVKYCLLERTELQDCYYARFTDDTGTFYLEDLASGDYHLEIWNKDFKDRKSFDKVPVSSGGLTSEIIINF